MTDKGGQRTRGTRTRRALLQSLGLSILPLAGCLNEETGDGSGQSSIPSEPRNVTASSTTSTLTPTPTPPPSPEPPPDHYVYVGRQQLEAIAERVRNGEQPWAKAYERAMRDADRALHMDPRSVVKNGAPEWNNLHRFGKDQSRDDYGAAMDMTSAVRDAALAYWFTDRDEYARRAVDLIHHWCLADDTYMKPNADIANNGTSITLWITIPKLWYGAALVRDHPYWTEKTGEDLERQFREWVRSFIDSIPGPGYYQYNNMWAWRIATIAGAASYLDDQELLHRAFCMWRGRCKTEAHGKDEPRPWNQYRPKGRNRGFLRQELVRHDAFGYHIYGMKALTTTAEIARLHDVDLYKYNAPTDPKDGSTLKKLFNFMVRFMKAPSRWHWGYGSDGLTNYERNTYASIFELAYSQWQKREFLEAIETVGRPVYDIRIFGWTSLLQANRFELDID